MDLKEEEITDELLAIKEDEFSEFAACISMTPEQSNERIESILKRAKLETVIKDSAGFAAEGVGKGLLSIIDTMARINDPDKKPKRSY